VESTVCASAKSKLTKPGAWTTSRNSRTPAATASAPSTEPTAPRSPSSRSPVVAAGEEHAVDPLTDRRQPRRAHLGSREDRNGERVDRGERAERLVGVEVERGIDGDHDGREAGIAAAGAGAPVARSVRR